MRYLYVMELPEEPLVMEQDAPLSQRHRAAGCVSFGQKLKTGTERQYTEVYVQPL